MKTPETTYDSSYYISLDYPVELSRWNEEGGGYWVAEIPDLPGCAADGETQDEALEALGEAKRLWIESRLENGHPVPEPANTQGYSGRLLVRMPKSLHRKLASQSKREGASLNMYVVSLLSGGVADAAHGAARSDA